MENKFKIKLPFMKKSRAAKASAAAHKLRLGKDPYFDWTVILGMFVASTLLWLSFGFALWQTTQNESFDSSGASSDTSTVSSTLQLNTNGLNDIISGETQKSQTASQYEARYTGPVDPSH